jgi:hypothetical protein
MNCSSCSALRAVYKCRLCRAAYCSAPCQAAHKAACTGAPTPAGEATAVREARNVSGLFDDGVDAPMVLNAQQLDALVHDTDIRDALKTPELRRLLMTIDGSRSRLDALAAAQHNVPEFREFCDAVLDRVTSFKNST